MKSKLLDLFKREVNESVTQDYRKLIAFIDAALTQSFKLSGDDRAEFLVKNFLNMRDFMSSEILIEDTKVKIKDNVIKLFEDFVKYHDLNLEEMEEVRRKKKEKELEVKQLNPENLLETDLSTSSKKEES